MAPTPAHGRLRFTDGLAALDGVVGATDVDAHTVADLTTPDVALVTTDTVAADEGAAVDGTGTPEEDDAHRGTGVSTHGTPGPPASPECTRSGLDTLEWVPDTGRTWVLLDFPGKTSPSGHQRHSGGLAGFTVPYGLPQCRPSRRTPQSPQPGVGTHHTVRTGSPARVTGGDGRVQTTRWSCCVRSRWGHCSRG